MLYHYTSIESLALILRSNKIRFNRLDKVDDILESTLCDAARYVFVSCWTTSSAEDIALWHIYANNMKGVRIGLSQPPFKKYRILAGEYAGTIKIPDTIENAPISIEQCIQDDYLIFPPYDDDIFFRKIEYLDDEAYKQRNESIIAESPTKTTIFNGDLGRIKHERWKFQNESRFQLMIFPQSFRQPRHLPLSERPSAPISYFDLDVDIEILKDMEVVRGVNCTDADQIIIDSLLTTFGVKQPSKKSSLATTIRHNK